MKLLIVDDMKSFLDLEKSFLSRADCRILSATTGLEAIKVAQMERPDLIILDVEMPEMNGIEATRILSSQKDLRDIPIVILSSTTRRDESITAGAREFIQKPIDEDAFLEMVRRYVTLPIRKDPRRPLDRPCTLSKEGQMGQGIVADLSVTGLFLKTPMKLAVGDRVHIGFAFPLDGSQKEVQADAIVVRIVGTGFGLRFPDLAEGTRLYIQEFVGS
jgi:CheY-like chemotaxis protein